MPHCSTPLKKIFTLFFIFNLNCEGGDMEKQNIIQEKSYQLALQVIELIKQFPQRTEGFVIGNQLCKAGTSVGANVEEAIAAFSKDDFTYKMSVSLKESRETHYWLRLTRDSLIVPKEIVSPIIPNAEEVMRILGAIVKSSRQK